MCLTYGRPPALLGEAVESFLRQDCEGPKELLVLNDFDQQTIVIDHPDVVVVNSGKRFRTVGEKRNACAALASHDILFVWDDDDIYLPHRISYSIAKMQSAERYRRFFKPSKALTLNNGVIGGPNANLYHSGSVWTRDFFDEVGGYPHMGSGQDMALELRFEEADKPHKCNFNAIAPEEIFYLYRWGGTGSFHLSGFGRDRDGSRPGNVKVEEYVERKLGEGLVPTGRIEITPAWEFDYTALVADHLKSPTAAT